MNDSMMPTVQEVLASLSTPIFLAGRDGARLTMHIGQPRRRRSLQKEASAALYRAGIRARCEVRELDHRRLAKAESLQDVLRPFKHQSVVYDPTGSIGLGQALLRCVGRLREQLGRTIKGTYFEPESRTLYLVCRRGDVSVGGQIDEAKQEGLKSQAAFVVESWRREDASSFDLPIRLCLEIPQMALVPVDTASLNATLPFWRAHLHAGMLAGGLTAIGSLLAPSIARASDPAVSQINGKFTAAGGDINDRAATLGDGSLAVPVGHSFGVQGDFSGGVANNKGLWGASGQGFWRDPAYGLFGGFFSHLERNVGYPIPGNHKVVMNRSGAEGEAYMGRVTVSALIGGQRGEVKHGAFITPDLAWYPMDNLKLHVGADAGPARSMGLGGLEYLLGCRALPGLAFSVETGWGQKGQQGGGFALAGFRYYFGPNKALIRRHREDDPSNLVGGGGIASTLQTPRFGNY